jgi:hypothetical protein
MRQEIKRALVDFENKHFSAVQTDTELAYCSDRQFDRVKATAKRYWDDANEARKKLYEMLEDV